eukprot:TRINITY_DN803_c0_g1_i3.p1 TRINITY_DN803_c0_g1~~TRINITY_DN803_c0_g1_i3.p1  ORF type:complete len:373 (+),score=83.54 TRINITY_DN803_c0_g1_i3:73-1191(+)
MLEQEIGNHFVREYYNTYANNPADLGRMYSKSSVFAHCEAGQPLEFTEGREAIHEKLKEELESDRKFELVNVDCIPSLNQSVLVLVQGMMLTKDASRGFAHTFLLGKNVADQAYYIHNDIMRICEPLDDDDDEEEEEEEEEELDEQDFYIDANAMLPTIEDIVTPPSRPVQPPSRTPEKQKVQATPPKKEKPSKHPTSSDNAAAKSSWATIASHSKGRANVPVQRVSGGAVAGGVSKKPAEKKRTSEREGRSRPPAKPAPAEKQRPKPSSKRSTSQSAVNYNYHSIFVTGLPQHFMESDVEPTFNKFGEVKGKTLQDIPQTRGGKRCFVDFINKSSVLKAIKEGVVFDGHTLNIQERKPPSERTKPEEEKKV